MGLPFSFISYLLAMADRTPQYQDPLEGLDFKDFMLREANHFLPEEFAADQDGPAPKQIEPELDHITERLSQIQAELEEINSMSPDQREAFAQERRDRDVERIKTQYEHDKKARERNLQMREQVKAWEPPSKEYDQLKQMALDDLARDVYPDDRWYEHEIQKVENRSTERYYDTQVEMLQMQASSVERHLKTLKTAYESINEWLAKLHENLNQKDDA